MRVSPLSQWQDGVEMGIGFYFFRCLGFGSFLYARFPNEIEFWNRIKGPSQWVGVT